MQNLQAALQGHARAQGAEAEDDFGLRLLTADDLPRLDALGIMGIVLLSSLPLPREAAIAGIPCVMVGEVDNPPRELLQVHADNLGRPASSSANISGVWGIGGQSCWPPMRRRA